jgi:hypothetical protein
MKSFFILTFILVLNSVAECTTLTLKPGPAIGKDAYLASSTPNSNFFNHPELAAEAWTCNLNPCNGRGIFAFDLSSIPQGAIITSARLSLFANTVSENGNGIAMQGDNASVLQRVITNWNENTVTWNNAPATTTQNQVTLSVSTSSFQSYPNIDVKNLVQDMVSNPSTSFGFLIKHVNETFYKSMIFASSDFADASKWPEITIEYEVLNTLPLVRNTFCRGSSTNVSYTSSQMPVGNVFSVQLSDVLGDFSNPIVIGQLSSTVSGSIPVTFPSNLPYGSGYRVRVVSSTPLVIGTNNGSDLVFLNPDDNNICSIDGCDPLTGLQTHTSINVNDNNLCTNDFCDPITGIHHDPVNTNDNNACTNDGCDPLTGIFHNQINIPGDGNLCTTDACNPISGPVYIPINPNDNNACTIDGCNPLTGVFHNPLVVPGDGNLCTDDLCDPLNGPYYSPVNPTDNNACTIDGCDPVLGNFHIPLSIQPDGNLCTIDLCEPQTGAIIYSPVNTNDNNACTIDGCDQATGAITHVTLNSDDHNACTIDGCDYINGVYHVTVNINDGNLCTLDACDPASGLISHTQINIDDQNACTIDGCNNNSGVFHTPAIIDDNNACTEDACNIINGFITHNQINIDDQNACTFDGCDFVSGVFHNMVNTDDGNRCTLDECNVLNGNITHTSIPTNDGNACTIDGCDNTNGVFHTPVQFDDQNSCTVDACDQITGIVSHTLINSNDNNACTFDGCDFISGVFHIATVTDDQNSCTNDACDPSTGLVTHIQINSDDRNECTIDGCDYVTGIYHTPIPTSDSNPCTSDACDIATGKVTHTLMDFDDKNLCTSDGCDPLTGIFHNYISIEDFNSCTLDGCDSLTGVFHTDNSPTITATYPPVLCYGNQTCVTIGAIGGLPPYSGDGIFCNYSAGNYTVEVTDAAGCLVAHSFRIIQPDKIIAAINATSASCGNANGSLEAIVTGGQMPYSYLWAPGNETTSTISGLSGGNYSVVVTDVNNCTTSMSGTVNVTGTAPNAPAAILGPLGACSGQSGVVYSVTPVSGATSYLWTLPAGVSGASSTSSITLSFSNSFSGGFICVQSVNGCGNSAMTCKNIIHITAKPGSIAQMSGPSTVCVSSVATFCIPSVSNATNYFWSIGGNGGSGPLTIISGQGTTCVNVNVPAGYNGNQELKVKAQNCLGASGTRKKDIHKTTVPNVPGNISGILSVCKSQSVAYSVGSANGATSYLWTITGGSVIASGQGTKNIVINFSSASGYSAVLSVVAVNSCGSSSASTKPITINTNCKVNPADGSVTESKINSVSAFPNPTSGIVTIAVNSDVDDKLSLKLTDLLGKRVYECNSNVIKGNNTIERNFDFLNTGIYFLIVEGDSFTRKTIRIIIE